MRATTSVKERLSEEGSVNFITDWLADHPGGTRTGLALAVCKRFELYDAKGAWRKASTLKALRDLEKEGRWRLPAALPRGSGAWTPRQLDHAVTEAQGVPSRAELIEGLELIEVDAQDYPQNRRSLTSWWYPARQRYGRAAAH